MFECVHSSLHSFEKKKQRVSVHVYNISVRTYKNDFYLASSKFFLCHTHVIVYKVSIQACSYSKPISEKKVGLRSPLSKFVTLSHLLIHSCL